MRSIDKMTAPTDHALTRDSLYGITQEPTYGGMLSFMRRRYSRELSNVDVAVMGIPFDFDQVLVSGRALFVRRQRALRGKRK